MTIEQAIKQAIIEGYDPIGRFEPQNREYAILLDPDFWKCLGKAMRWATEKEIKEYEPHRMGSHGDTWGCQGDDDPCYCDKPKDWKVYWHKLIDHLADGGKIETYFKDL